MGLGFFILRNDRLYVPKQDILVFSTAGHYWSNWTPAESIVSHSGVPLEYKVWRISWHLNLLLDTLLLVHVPHKYVLAIRVRCQHPLIFIPDFECVYLARMNQHLFNLDTTVRRSIGKERHFVRTDNSATSISFVLLLIRSEQSIALLRYIDFSLAQEASQTTPLIVKVVEPAICSRAEIDLICFEFRE